MTFTKDAYAREQRQKRLEIVKSINTVSNPLYGRGMQGLTLDASVNASGGAFLESQLEKFDPILHEPLHAETWARDISAEPGGGPVDYTSAYFVNYATAGTNQNGIISNESNVIPIIQANIEKDIFKVFAWAHIIQVKYLDMIRQQQMGRSLDQIMFDGLQISYEKMLDWNVYYGFSEYGTYGLTNNPSVTQSFVANNGSAGDTLWKNKTPAQILKDVNDAINAVWTATQFADVPRKGMPNFMGIPPAQFNYLVSQPLSVVTGSYSTVGGTSILKFLEQNNAAAAQGVDFKIVPMRQLTGAGDPATTGGANTDRMVIYNRDPYFLSFDLCQPLTKVFTAPSPEKMAYLTPYYAYVGQVKFKYLQTIQYFDGI